MERDLYPTSLPSVGRRALAIFDQIDAKNGLAGRTDLLKIAGNEHQLNNWIEYMTTCNLILAVQIEGRIHYRKTDIGEKIHVALKLHPYVGRFFEDIGKKRRLPQVNNNSFPK